tara:strand:+ start:1580 stop:2437 length:858 start_codon:yes stop_codon:yes gene_type:complete
MLHSMTGYGSTSFNTNNLSFEIEIKTLNSKFFDSKIILPNFLSSRELEIGNILKNKLLRGKVELKIKCVGNYTDSISFNKEVIKSYFDELKEISDFDSSHLLKAIINLPNSIDKNELNFSESDLEKLDKAIEEVIDNVIAFRLKEGISIAADLQTNSNNIDLILSDVIQLSESHSIDLKNNLSKKINDLSIEIDKNRFEQEVVYYLEKIDINEELVRLKSHLNYFNDIMNDEKVEKGKKLGFICQEIGREVNTIGSKVNNSQIQTMVVEMKTCLEKLREQVLNTV